MSDQQWTKHAYYEKANRFYVRNNELFLSEIDPAGGFLLDIGCHDGSISVAAGKKAGAEKVFGIELEEDLVRMAKEKNVEAIKANIDEGLPYESNFFQSVVSNQVIEHVQKPDQFIKEAYRVLKPGGQFIISTANIAALHNIFLMILGYQPSTFHLTDVQVGNPFRGVQTSGHIQAIALPALRELCEQSGFKVEKTFGAGHHGIPLPISNMISAITPRHAIYIGLKAKKAQDSK